MIRKKSSDYFELEQFETIIEHYLSKDKNKKALTAVERAMEQYPFSGELVAAKAQVLSNLERYEEAEQLLSDYRAVNPYDMDALLNLGSVYTLQQKYQDAIALLEDALVQAEDMRDEIFFNLGLAYQGQGKWEEAIVHYKAAIDLNLSHEGALYELAYCLDQVGELENSLSYYSKFIDEDPFSAAAWYNLGIVYNKLERFDEAIEAYSYALAIDEQFSSAHFNLGNACLSAGRWSEAVEAFRQTLDLEGPGSEVYCSFGLAYEGMGQFDLALRYFQKSTKLDPLYDEAWFGAGVCMEKKEQWHQALHFYGKAVKLDFNNPGYWKAMARMDFKIGNIVSALSAFEEAARLDPTDREVWLEWSAAYYEQGDPGLAADVLVDALSELADDAEIRYRLAAYLILEGRMQEALHHLHQALETDLDRHDILFDYFPKADMQGNLLRFINQFYERRGKGDEGSSPDDSKPSEK